MGVHCKNLKQPTQTYIKVCYYSIMKNQLSGLCGQWLIFIFTHIGIYGYIQQKGRCCRMAKLTEKQRRFVDEYLIDLNATRAAIRAGYKVDNARQTATENLAKPYIAEAIEKAIAERSRRTGINQDRVIQELAKIAFVNITDIVNNDCEILSDADRADLAAIESVKVKTIPTKNGEMGVEREVKLSSKLKALEMLGKHLGMWNNKLEVSMNVPVIFEGETDIEE